MEAKVSESWPRGEFAYEPKWDGFRSLSWNGGEIRLDSRNQKTLLRYFPELREPISRLPLGTVVDGEIVVVVEDVTEFDSLQQRIHPAESRIKRLAAEFPAQLVAFDLLALAGSDLRSQPFAERRRHLRDLVPGLGHPWNLTPSTDDEEEGSDDTRCEHRRARAGRVAPASNRPTRHSNHQATAPAPDLG